MLSAATWSRIFGQVPHDDPRHARGPNEVRGGRVNLRQPKRPVLLRQRRRVVEGPAVAR